MVITVCDQAAGEHSPLWFGQCQKVHWGLADPSRMAGTKEEVATAFRQTIKLLQRRLRSLIAAEPQSLDSEQLSALLMRLGEV